MTFPLMWRSVHEALVAEDKATIADLRAANRQLLRTVLRLKAEGAITLPKASLAAPAEVDPLDVVIEDKAQGDVALMRHYRKQVQRLRARGLADPVIAEAIHSGEEPE